MRVAALTLLALASCATAPPLDNPYDLVGVWGGQHASLTVGTLDASVEFDCAEGMVVAPYHVAGDGSFEWDGTFVRGTGGPVRVGEVPPEEHAVYAGMVNWPDKMRLSVKLDDGLVLGPFQLRRGAESQLTRCL